MIMLKNIINIFFRDFSCSLLVLAFLKLSDYEILFNLSLSKDFFLLFFIVILFVFNFYLYYLEVYGLLSKQYLIMIIFFRNFWFLSFFSFTFYFYIKELPFYIFNDFMSILPKSFNLEIFKSIISEKFNVNSEKFIEFFRIFEKSVNSSSYFNYRDSVVVFNQSFTEFLAESIAEKKNVYLETSINYILSLFHNRDQEVKTALNVFKIILLISSSTIGLYFGYKGVILLYNYFKDLGILNVVDPNLDPVILGSRATSILTDTVSDVGLLTASVATSQHFTLRSLTSIKNVLSDFKFYTDNIFSITRIVNQKTDVLVQQVDNNSQILERELDRVVAISKESATILNAVSESLTSLNSSYNTNLVRLDNELLDISSRNQILVDQHDNLVERINLIRDVVSGHAAAISDISQFVLDKDPLIMSSGTLIVWLVANLVQHKDILNFKCINSLDLVRFLEVISHVENSLDPSFSSNLFDIKRIILEILRGRESPLKNEDSVKDLD